MLRELLLFICSVPIILGIIVTDPPPTDTEYKYSYNIEDPTTGDTKSQYEVRHGGTVSGAYSVIDPDGTKRTVEYTADPKEGFKAVVRKEPAENVVSQKESQYIPKENTYQYDARYQAKPDYVTDVRMEDSDRHSQNQYYDKVNYVQQPVYFTPENELSSEDNTFAHGQYFIPNNH